MAKSKHRKKQVADNRKHLEKAKKRHKTQNWKSEELEKENIGDVSYQSQNDPPPLERRGNELQTVPYNNSGWLSGMYGWCQAGISSVVTQSVEVAKDVMFPSWGLKKELEEAKEKLKEMERELNSIKQSDSEDTKQPDVSHTLPPLVVDAAAALPPPPPPPPPPIPPPQAPISFRKVLTRSRSSKLAKTGKELPPVTLDDIKRVKLRPSKVSFMDSGAGEPGDGGGSSGSFVVSMKDLKNVQLRKTSDKAMKKSSRRKSFHCSRVEPSPPEFCRMRSILKKVSPSMCRSKTTDDDFGEGPTPMLTRALRKKFQAACPVSPIKSFSSSPSPSSNSLGRSPLHRCCQNSPLVVTESHLT